MPSSIFKIGPHVYICGFKNNSYYYFGIDLVKSLRRYLWLGWNGHNVIPKINSDACNSFFNFYFNFFLKDCVVVGAWEIIKKIPWHSQSSSFEKKQKFSFRSLKILPDVSCWRKITVEAWARVKERSLEFNESECRILFPKTWRNSYSWFHQSRWGDNFSSPTRFQCENVFSVIVYPPKYIRQRLKNLKKF